MNLVDGAIYLGRQQLYVVGKEGIGSSLARSLVTGMWGLPSVGDFLVFGDSQTFDNPATTAITLQA